MMMKESDAATVAIIDDTNANKDEFYELSTNQDRSHYYQMS